jgi:eukaryotic-like serine/threonine-protein kinase
MRDNRLSAATSDLIAAETRAVACGDDAYETRVVALLLLGSIASMEERLEAAERYFAETDRLCRERGDRLHLSILQMNLAHLAFARRDRAAAVATLQEYRTLSREVGVPGNEYRGEYNLGETHYQLGRFEEGWTHAQRAIELARRGGGRINEALLLQARLLLLDERRAEARALRDQLLCDATMRSGGLSSSEEVLATLVDLATRPASDDEWEALERKSRECGGQQDTIEVAEQRAIAVAGAGRFDDALRYFDVALALARHIPNLLEERLLRGRSHCCEQAAQKPV